MVAVSNVVKTNALIVIASKISLKKVHRIVLSESIILKKTTVFGGASALKGA